MRLLALDIRETPADPSTDLAAAFRSLAKAAEEVAAALERDVRN